jgi:hypothetical protein
MAVGSLPAQQGAPRGIDRAMQPTLGRNGFEGERPIQSRRQSLHDSVLPGHLLGRR